jgi:hypothetical protein
MKHLRLWGLSSALVVASTLLSGCLAAAPLPPPGIAVSVGFTPGYYDGYAVYYDDWGYPYYYTGGVAYYVPRTYVHYDLLARHYRPAPLPYYRRGYVAYRYHGGGPYRHGGWRR